MFSKEQIAHFGDELFDCLISSKTVQPLRVSEPSITVDDAYRISLYVLDRRMRELGHKQVGKKIGVTSDAVQSMLGVFEPDFGFLTDTMQFGEGKVPIGTLIQPRAEAEIAFRLNKDLRGPNVTMEDVLDATESVMACFEIVDSRIENWNIAIEDTVADNASCGVFVVAEQGVDPKGLDLAESHVKVYKNGELLSEGAGSAVQGSPLQAVAWLANTFGERGLSLSAGDIVLSGSLVPLEPITPGDTMSMNLSGIGSLELEFVI